MKKIKALFCSFGLMGMLLTAGACGDDATADMQKMVDKACACKDAKCIEEVTKEWTEMGKKWAEKAGSGDIDAEDAKKMAELGQKFAKCAQDAMSGGAGGE